MPSSIQEPIQLQDVDIPTTSFGVAADGWVTKWMDVRYLDEINLGLDITKSTTTSLQIRLESSSKSRVDVAVDDGDIVNKVETDGSAIDDIITKALTADTKISLRISTKSVEFLRVSVLADSEAATVVGVVSFDVPHSRKASAPSIFV